MNIATSSIEELRRALGGGHLSLRELLDDSIRRIEDLDGRFRAVIALDHRATELADDFDSVAGHTDQSVPLRGIPVLVKDNLETESRSTQDPPTTAGSLALANYHARTDATVVRKLRDAGAIVMGKSNLSEWANFRSSHSSSGWSSVGLQTGNAHNPIRTPGGSSSGSAVAVALGYCAGAIGTETDGSVVGPSAMNGIVGFKPTVGWVSRAGIVPLSASQDTAGPMARSVRDVAALLDAIVGEDSRDAATEGCRGKTGDFVRNLGSTSLRGARIGVARSYTGYHEGLDTIFESALRALGEAGAIIVDPVELPDRNALRPDELIVMATEFKEGLDLYLAALPDGIAVRSLAQIIEFNTRNANAVLPHFGHDLLVTAQMTQGTNRPEYLVARERSKHAAGHGGIDAAMAAHGLDVIVAPTTSPAWLIDHVDGDNRKGGCSGPAAIAGYPHITVPMGAVAGLPVGLSIFASAWEDQKVLDIGFAFEQCTHALLTPQLGS